MTGRDTNVLKEIATKYSQAHQRYQQAMHRGDMNRADEALAEMQELERNTTVIQHGRGK